VSTPAPDLSCADEPIAGRCAPERPVPALIAELLGTAREGARRRVPALLERFPLAALSRLGAARLVAEGGLTPAAGRRLAAAFELGRAVERARCRPGDSLRTPERVYRLMAPELRGLEQESFHVLILDSKHRLKERCAVSAGTLTTSLVHPREVFRDAIRLTAAAIVVVHNHPSGDPEPSAEDMAVTRRLIDAGRLLGIPVLDHVIVGNGAWVSLRGRMDFRERP